MFLTRFLCIFTLLLSVAARANVYADPKEPNIDHFIKITKKNESYSFQLCLVEEKNSCHQIGLQESYSVAELEGKVRTLKDRTAMSNLGALGTGGLTLLLSARLYLMRKSIESKTLNRDQTLSYQLSEKGEAYGTLEQYLERLERALKIPATTL
ncbi:MAG: hypothetical protein A2X86_08340 [Bdellovibrionales bacterium GWA2_49_15]|nr:MAG: hypothetical protein A2X86_08340 [Bdellovibrionales bacterium GWA2_49_15]HAZ11230.1 hypothetical protein [Bdellovibrionales bacterium]